MEPITIDDHVRASAARRPDELALVEPIEGRDPYGIALPSCSDRLEAVNAAVDLPIIIYNIPGRSVIDMSVETMARCAELENVIGVKDATAAVNRATEQKMACGDDFCQLSGEDVTQLGFLAQGGVGCISVTANVAPKLMSEMHEAWQKGDIAGAQNINERLTPLHVDLFCEANPGPVKYGASLLGKCEEELRLPLVPITEESRGKVERAMRHAGLLN